MARSLRSPLRILEGLFTALFAVCILLAMATMPLPWRWAQLTQPFAEDGYSQLVAGSGDLWRPLLLLALVLATCALLVSALDLGLHRRLPGPQTMLAIAFAIMGFAAYIGLTWLTSKMSAPPLTGTPQELQHWIDVNGLLVSLKILPLVAYPFVAATTVAFQFVLRKWPLEVD